MGRARVLLAALVAAGACSSSPAKPVDAGYDYVWVDPRTDVCGEGGATPAMPPFELVQQIFNENCVSCHAPGADLNLAQDVSWANLVGQPAPAAEACGGVLVVAGDPNASYLYQKVTSPTPCSGVRMPRGEFGSAPPLPDCVLAILHDWIAAGAPGPSADGGADSGGDGSTD
jgi:hypothetical protein